MWMMDRDLDEHQVYDHFSTVPADPRNLNSNPQSGPQIYQPNGGVSSSGPPNGGIYAHLQPPNSSTPTTTNSMGMDSSLNGGGPPPPISMGIDSNSLHQHSTLPAVDHRLPMDTHHLEGPDNVQDIYGQNLYHQPTQPVHQHYMTESGLLITSSSSGLALGHPYGDQETTMMMQSPNGHEAELLGHQGHLHEESHAVMACTSKKSKDSGSHNYLQMYARQLGLNDRGCYVAVGLAGLAFLLFVIVIAMGATWPGKREISGPVTVSFCIIVS